MNTGARCLGGSAPEIQGLLMLHEPMSLHTSFRIGGPADIFAVPSNVYDVQVLRRWASGNSVPFFVLGAGTNLLVADSGIRGLVVQLGSGFDNVRIKGCEFRAGGAAKLSRAVRKSLGSGLCGLEGLVGVPGTVGGAICMNAGTPAGCIKDTLASITAMDADGELRDLSASDLGLRYRGSMVPGSGLIILEAIFNLRRENAADIDGIVGALRSNRRRNQPVRVGTAGSVFKNPPDGYAGQLLEAVGAKGMRVGGARVSGKHANFIENTGLATAEDVHDLMMNLQRLVMDKFGVLLEPEIQLVGER